MQDVTLEVAEEMVEAARRRAEKIGVPMNIAIVDAGGNLKAFARMDGAWLGSIDIALKKARTARLFDMETGDIGKLSKPGGPLYMIEVSNDGLISFPGGIPVFNEEDEVIGAIGVSGGSVKEDRDVASEGVKTIKDAVRKAA